MYYEFKDRLKHNGQYTTYKLSENGVDKIFSAAQVRSLLKAGTEIAGIALTRDNRIIKSSHASFKGVGTAFEVYTGTALRQQVNAQLGTIAHSRKFVTDLYSLVTSPIENRIIGVAGLRGTGKTTGLLQCIRQLNCYEDTVLIAINTSKNITIDCETLYAYIRKNCINKYVFVDEITSVNGLITDSQCFADWLKGIVKKLVFCGTNSLALCESEKSALHHRIFILHTTFISYQDAKVTLNFSFSDYLQMGGLYKPYELTSVDGVYRYLVTSVVENILTTIEKNGSYFDSTIKRLSRQTLTAIVCTILVSVIYDKVKSPKNFNAHMVSGAYIPVLQSIAYDRTTIDNLVCNIFGLTDGFNFEYNDAKIVLDCLCAVGLVYKTEHKGGGYPYVYYITNPAMYNQIISKMIEVVDDSLSTQRSKNERKLTATLNKGMLLEDIVVCHVINAAKKARIKHFFFRKGTKEVDLVLRIDSTDFDTEPRDILFEIKSTAIPDGAVMQAEWLFDNSIFKTVPLEDKNIIYMGTTMTFNSFDSLAKPPKGRSIEWLRARESVARGIKLINAEDFILGLNSRQFWDNLLQ